MLQIAEDLQLPPQTMTLTCAALGIRGSGKTNSGVVITEELLKQSQQVVVLDPLNVWWGLKSSFDGQSPGFPITVLGGPNGDLPLAPTDGEAVALFLAENRVSAILSLRHMRKGEQKRFVADFAEAFYQAKGRPGLGTPVLVVIDEASTFVPQSFQGDSARCVGAIEDLVRRGRASGLGVMLIDQRAASVNKDVLTQLELLITHQTTSPQDRAALKLWVSAHDTKGVEKEFLDSLASLPRGTAWFWAPGQLGLFQRVTVRKRETFDSSATPELGKAIETPTALAAPDLEALRAKLDRSLDEARGNDPTVLKAKVAELTEQLAQRPHVDAAQLEQFRSVAHDLIGMGKDLNSLGVSLLAQLGGLKSSSESKLEPAPQRPRAPQPIPKAPAPELQMTQLDEIHSIPMPGHEVHKLDLHIPDAQQRIIDGLAMFSALGLHALDEKTLAVASRQSPKSSAYKANLSDLKALGLIQSSPGKKFELTETGSAGAHPSTHIQNRADLHREWLAKFSGFQKAMLTALIAHYPTPISRDELADEVGQSRKSSLVGENINGLRSWGLVATPGRGTVCATTVLFPKGLK